jgi:hypothetical protein
VDNLEITKRMVTCRQQAIASIVGMLAFVVLPSDASGQSVSQIARGLNQQGAPSALVLAPALDLRYRSLIAERIGAPQAAPPGSSPDTLKNGAIIGAVVGAVTLGAFGALICNLEQEPGAGNCLSDTLRVAAIGAGIGVGAGLAVDAALTRQGGITVRFGIKF